MFQSFVWITLFKVNYKRIFYLLDTARDSIEEQGTNELYTTWEYMQSLVTVDIHNVQVLP